MAESPDPMDVTRSVGELPLTRRRMLKMLSLGGASAFLAACTGTATTPESPTATLAVVQPGGLTPETAPTVAPAPTTAPAPTKVPEPTTAAPTTAPGTGEGFQLNGVTLPYKRSETIVLDQTDYSVFDSFNIYIPNGNEFANGYYQQSIEYLWYANYVTGEITPWLATGFKYNSDYTELTITLRNDANWNDGEPFTAEDVAFTMNLQKDNPELGGESNSKFWKEIKAADPTTVVISFTEPRPREHQMFYCKICTGYVIQPKHIWEKQDPKTFKNNPPVTTGPWMFEKAYPEQKLFVWKRNEKYWNKAFMPAAQYLIYRKTPPSDQQLPEAEAGNADSISVEYDVYVQNKDKLSFINMVAYLDPCPRGVFFNCAQAPFDTAEFRRATSMLINRQKIAENIWAPPSKPAAAPWADYRNLDQYINKEANDKWATLVYNPEAALKLMGEVGYKQDGGKLVGPDGKQVSFEISTPGFAAGDKPSKEYLIAVDLSEECNKLGMLTSVKPMQGDTFWNALDEGRWAVGSWWMCGATVDPLELFGGFTSDRAVPIGTRTTNGNEMRLQDEELDAVISELKKITPEDAKAKDLYMQAYDAFMRSCPGVPVIQTIYTSYWNTKYWGNELNQESLYTVPFNWWGQYMFITMKAKPTAA